jgi:hypothetical protein
MAHAGRFETRWQASRGDSRIGKALNIIYTLSIRNRHLSQ